MEIIIKRKNNHLRLPRFVVCDQVCHSFNQITVFVDQKNFIKISIGILNFLYGVSHHGKAASETTAFGWMWLGVLLVQLYCRIL